MKEADGVVNSRDRYLLGALNSARGIVKGEQCNGMNTVTWATRLTRNSRHRWEWLLLATSWFPGVTLLLQFVEMLEDSREAAFVISNQLPPPWHAKARRAELSLVRSTWPQALKSRWGNANGSQTWAAGTHSTGRGACWLPIQNLLVPSATKCPQESPGQGIFASNQHCRQSRDCSAVSDQASSPTKQGLHHTTK